MKNTTMTKTRQQTRTTENTNVGIDTVSKNSIAVMGGVSALIGIWSMACFVGAMAASGGPLGMASSWFHAISGM